MGLANLKKKDAAMGKKPKPKILKVNKYESPQMALNLIAHIMTSSADMSVKDDFKKWEDFYNSLKEKFQSQAQISDEDFHDSFVEASLNDLTWNCGIPDALLPYYMEETNGRPTIRIAVCGGYSSGKSSFLNHLLDTGNALPTGIEPVSMVNTYINCSSEFKRLSVKGKNCKNKLVRLNREVLECIQHSSKSKVYVKTVLDTLYVDLPVNNERKYLEGLTFVDTPGYNNSDNVNSENGATDKQTALEAAAGADAVIWCIDSEAGTISKNDIDILNDAICDDGSVPYIIVFTKMDKKPQDQMQQILKGAEKVCRSNLKVQPIDILGYSCVNTEHSVLSLNSLKSLGNRAWNIAPSQILKSTFEQLKKKSTNEKTADYWLKEIEDYFMTEISDTQERIGKLEELRQQYAEEKGKAFKEATEDKNNSKTILEGIKDIMLDNYDEQLDWQNTLNDAVSRLIDEFEKATHREVELSGKLGWFSDASSIEKQHNAAIESFNKLINHLNNEGWPSSWKLEDRQSLYKNIEDTYKFSDEALSETQSASDNYDDVVRGKKILKQYVNFLMKESTHADSIFRDCCDKAMNRINYRLRKMQDIEEVPEADVFTAIAADNTEQFLQCFSDGVDLTKCNNQGYSPLTFIARCSNNIMMKFLIDHDVDLSLKDERGYNALETAVIYHCRDICEMLIDHDKSLIDESKSLAELADNDKFEQWIAKY